VIIPISTFSASIGLIEELSFTIPKLQGVILDIDFNDINGDNIPEVLACDTNIWVLYSMTGDSIIAWDSLPKYDDLLGYYSSVLEGFVKVLLGDLDNDSIHDIAVARIRLDISGPFVDSSVVIIKYDGSSSFLNSDTIYFNSGNCLTGCPTVGIGVLELSDINYDGSKELFFSFRRSFPGLDFESTSGRTFLFNSFPDTISTHNYLALSRNKLYGADSTLAFITENYRNVYSSIPGSEIRRINQNIAYVDSVGAIHDWTLDFPTLPSANCIAMDIERIATLGCIGNLVSTFTGLHIALLKKSYLRCTKYPFTGDIFDTTNTELAVYRLISLDSIEQVWSKNIQEVYDNFVYLSQFPGFFCVFVDDVFTQFNGSDGSIFQATAAVPTGKREWAYPFNDSIPRLIVKNGPNVSFYLTDISTPVYENDPPTLPDDFRLSQPYPNPFNPQLNLSLFIPRRSEVVVKVFNIVGQQVDVLYNDVASAGELKLQWNAKDNPSGIYLIKAISGNQSSTVKAVLLK